jgi:hypothetical protein
MNPYKSAVVDTIVINTEVQGSYFWWWPTSAGSGADGEQFPEHQPQQKPMSLAFTFDDFESEVQLLYTLKSTRPKALLEYKTAKTVNMAPNGPKVILSLRPNYQVTGEMI